MIVVLVAWVVLSLLLGVLIGKAIHRADVVERCWRPDAAVPLPPVRAVEASEGRSTAGWSDGWSDADSFWAPEPAALLAPAIAAPQR